MKTLRSRKAQAITDLATIGSLILLVFGTMLVYVQQLNDKQHATMESFRRTLKQAYEGNGALVHGVFIENRRVISLDGGLKKGSPQQNMVSSDVFWAVPDEFAPAGNTATRMEGNEEVTYYPQLRPDEIADKYAYYQVNEQQSENLIKEGTMGGGEATVYESPVSDFMYDSRLNFNETSTSGIGTSTSMLTENVTTNLTDSAGDEVATFSQGIHKDEDGGGYYYDKGGGSVTNVADY